MLIIRLNLFELAGLVSKHIMILKYLKTLIILSVILIVVRLVPEGTIDPWNLLSPKKTVIMIFALAFIQGFGAIMIQLLGSRTGTILAGFFGGLISSTATTAALARESINSTKTNSSKETLTFLCATLAMLVEGAAILFLGTENFHAPLFLIFLGQIITTVFLIFYQFRKTKTQKSNLQEIKLEFLPILKLTLFIIAILAASKFFQTFLGDGGIYLLTFVVSLFEIHGSVIANIQLHDSGAFNAQFLGSLLAISVAASYISKLFLIFTLGSPPLKSAAIKYTGVLFLSLLACWLTSYLM